MRFPFSSRLDGDNYFFSIAKTAFKKIGDLIYSMKSLSYGVTFNLYNFTMPSCMKYCCHPWVGTSSCYLDKLDKLEKWVCMAAGPVLATSLELLTHHLNRASSSLFSRDFNAGKVQLVSLERLNNCGAVVVEKKRSLIKNHHLRSWDFLSLLDWMETIILSLLLKLPSRRLETWFILWNLFPMGLLLISKILPSDLAWNTVVIPELVPLAATWISWIS